MPARIRGRIEGWRNKSRMDRRDLHGCRQKNWCARDQIPGNAALRISLQRAAEYCERKSVAGGRFSADPRSFRAQQAECKARRNAGRSRPKVKPSALLGRTISYENVQRSRKHVEADALQMEAFAVHHHRHRCVKRKFNFAHGRAGRERMFDVRAVKKTMKIPKQSQASNRTPAYILNQAVIGIGVGGDHHLAAGKLTVAESLEEAAAAVKLRGAVGTQGKRAAIQARKARQYAQNVAKFAPALEAAIGDVRHVRRETQRQ